MADQHTTKLFKGDSYAPLLDANGCSVHGSGRKIWVRAAQQQDYLRVAAAAKNNYGQMYVHGQINSLRHMGFLQSLFSKLSFSERTLPLEGGALVYEVSGGDVYLKDIQVNQRYSHSLMKAKAGVYRVSNERGRGWRVEGAERDLAIEQNGVRTKHIAVNGQSPNIAHAATFMPAFIQYAYGETALSGKVYNLFYNPSSGYVKAGYRALVDSTTVAGGGTQAARKLADMIKDLSKSERDYCWTIQENGHALFKRALSIASQGGVSGLTNHQVFYANPTQNIALVDNLRKKIGMKLAAKPMLINDMSIQQAWLSGNVLSDSVVSMRHIAEQGESSELARTKRDVGMRAVKRMGFVSGMASLPTLTTIMGLVGLPAWALGMLAVLPSQGEKANQRVISGTEDALRQWGNK